MVPVSAAMNRRTFTAAGITIGAGVVSGSGVAKPVSRQEIGSPFRNEAGYGAQPGGWTVERVWGGLPMVMAIDRAGRYMGVADPTRGGVHIVDLVSHEILSRISPVTGERANYGDGSGGSPMNVSRDQTALLWVETDVNPDFQQSWVRRAEIDSGVVTTLATFEHSTGISSLTDTPFGVVITMNFAMVLISDAAAKPISLGALNQPREPLIVVDGSKSLIAAQTVEQGIVCANIGAAGVGPLTALPVEGSLIDIALENENFWVATSGRVARDPNLPVDKVYLFDASNLELKLAVPIVAGLRSPTSLGVGPNGVFLSTLGPRLYHLSASNHLPPTVSVPESTQRVIDTDMGLYGKTPFGIWRIASKDIYKLAL